MVQALSWVACAAGFAREDNRKGGIRGVKLYLIPALRLIRVKSLERAIPLGLGIRQTNARRLDGFV